MGAFALIWDKHLSIWPTPLDPDAIAGTTVDDAALLQIAREIASADPVCVVIEHVWGIAGQAAGPAFVFGDTNGATRLALRAAGVRIERVSGARWKNRLGVFGDKSASIAKAIELFPNQSDLFRPRRGVRTAKQCEGIAEAALIAHYGSITYV